MNPCEQHLVRDEELRDLIAATWNGTINVEQIDRLEEILNSDESAQEHYLTCMALHGRLMWRHRGATEQVKGLATDNRRSQNDFSVDFEDYDSPLATPSLPGTHYPLSTTFVGGPVFSYLVATVILCLMLLGGWAYTINHDRDIFANNNRRSTTPGSMDRPKMVVVGQITGMKDCQWSDPNTQTIVSAAVSLDRKYALASGLLEITYKTGAKVILEGPCMYKVESAAGGFLERGKLTARIAHRGPAASVAGAKPKAVFIVSTPTAVITDLGTEFGVEVNNNGETVSHVFQGSVRVESIGGVGSASVAPVKLNAGEAVRVTKDTAENVRFTHTTTMPTFVRRIPTPRRNYIDLADIVAGGDGFGWKRGRGIDAVTGRIVLSQPKERKVLQNLFGDASYHPVDELPFVDGVFIPDGGQGPVQTTSVGHRTTAFTDTANKTWNYIWAGRIIAGYTPNLSTYCWLGDTNYAGRNHSVISIPTNKGITFDLDAIRRKYPDVETERFTCVAGNGEIRSNNPTADRVSADLWVFVDGVLKFSKTNVNSLDGGFCVDIPLKPENRFLTLAATDSGNGLDSDWTMFGDAHLVIKTIVDAGGKEKTPMGK